MLRRRRPPLPVVRFLLAVFLVSTLAPPAHAGEPGAPRVRYRGWKGALLHRIEAEQRDWLAAWAVTGGVAGTLTGIALAADATWMSAPCSEDRICEGLPFAVTLLVGGPASMTFASASAGVGAGAATRSLIARKVREGRRPDVLAAEFRAWGIPMTMGGAVAFTMAMATGLASFAFPGPLVPWALASEVVGVGFFQAGTTWLLWADIAAGRAPGRVELRASAGGFVLRF